MARNHIPSSLLIAFCAALFALGPAAVAAGPAAASRVVYASHAELIALSPHGGHARRLAAIPMRTVDAAASADGLHFALIANRSLPPGERGSIRTIYRLDLRGGLHRVHRLRASGPLSIAMSSDGRRIAICRGGEIWTMHGDGSHFRRVTSGPGIAFDPAFGAGRRFLVLVRSVGGTTRLQRAALRGPGEWRLPGTWEAHDPDVARDGRIAFRRVAESPRPDRLVVMDAEGGRRHTVRRSREPVFDGEPSFSPRADRIAFLRLWQRTGSASSYRYSVHTVGLGGANHRRLIGGLRSTATESFRKGRGPAGPLWTGGSAG